MNQTLTGKSRKRVLALSLGLALTGCDFFHETTDAEYVARAKDYQDKGDLRSSIIELKGALQKNPNNAEARRLLGELSLIDGNGAAAEKELRRALELGVARETILIPLLQALLIQGKNAEVLNESGPVPALSLADQAKIAALRGNAWLALEEFQKAKVEYEKGLAIDEKSASARLGMARLAIRDKDLDHALNLVDAALQSESNLADAWSLKAELEQAKRELEKAEASYSKAIELRRANAADRANRALLRIELKKLDDAKSDIEVLKNNTPNYFLGHYADGIFKLDQKKYPEAQVAFEEAAKRNEKFTPIFYFLAATHLYQNHLAQADKDLSRFLGVFPSSAKATQLMALIKFQKKDFEAARTFLTPVMQSMPEDVFTLKLMANIEFAMGERDKGLEYLKKVVELDPKSPISKLELGIGLFDAGYADKGMEMLKTAVELDPNLIQADAYMALVHLQAKEFEKAQTVIGSLKKKIPESPLPLNLDGMFFVMKNDLDNAKKSFHEALKISPKDLTASDSLAKIALQEKKLDTALDLYSQIIKDHPEHISAYLTAAELQANKGNAAETESYLKLAIERSPQALSPRVLLARFYTRQGRPKQAEVILQQVRQDYFSNPEFLEGLVEAQLEGNEVAAALDTASAFVKAVPGSALAHFSLARAYEANNDLAKMRSELKKTLEIDPGFPSARVALVKLLATEKKLVEAEAKLKALEKDFPDGPEVFALSGWFSLQQGKPSEAINAYQKAFDQSPHSSYLLALAKAHWIAGEREKAINTLRDWVKQNPNSGLVHYTLAGMYMSLGRNGDAEDELRRVVEINPDNHIALNDLAWLLRQKNPDAALEYAEKAASLKPRAVPVLDTLALILLDKHQNQRALGLLKDAVGLAPKDPTIRYHLALAQENNGEISNAIETLEQLLNEKEAFPEKRDASDLLKRLRK